MDILIVKPKWAYLILLDVPKQKTWEIRGCNTTKRGRIGIAKSKTQKIYGEVTITDSIPLTKQLWEENKEKHQVLISWEDLLKHYKKPYAWVFSNAVRYENAVPYIHKPGAVIWVKQ